MLAAELVDFPDPPALRLSFSSAEKNMGGKPMKAKTINQNTTYDGWEELGNAVVVQAADDYRAAVMRLRMFPRDEVARRMMKDAEEFFHSPRFSMFSSADPIAIFKQLQKECGIN